MSTANLRTAVEHSTPTAARAVAELLDGLGMHAALHMAAAESVVARLASEDHRPEDADRERAVRALDVAVRAHTVIQLVGAVLRSLADPDTTDALSDALSDATAAADPAVVAAVRKTLLGAATTDSAPLCYAILGELRRAQDEAATMGAAPDTIPPGWC